MGGGGAPAPNIVNAGTGSPVPVNPFASMAGNAPYQPGTVGAGNATSKDWSGVMNAPQGAPRALPNTQSFPAAPLVTGGAGSPGISPSDFTTALSQMLSANQQATAPAPAPTPAPAPAREPSDNAK